MGSQGDVEYSGWRGSGARGAVMEHTEINYTVRESLRAKRVILKVGANGLEVVVPRRFGRRKLPGILEANRQWIEKELQRVSESPPLVAPGCIDLIAVDESWQVYYLSHSASEGKFSVKESDSNRLLVEGDVEDIGGVSSVLTQWLRFKAHAHLVPWLKEVSLEFDIPFQRATVRGQTTRWASCSQAGDISLNRSLLFLPKSLVRHVFLHELCHIKKLNHSPEFWNLLHQLEPAYKDLEADLKKANRYVPQWVSLR